MLLLLLFATVTTYCKESTLPYYDFVEQRTNRPNINFVIITLVGGKEGGEGRREEREGERGRGGEERGGEEREGEEGEKVTLSLSLTVL